MSKHVDTVAMEVVITHGGVDVPLTAAYQATVERAALAAASKLPESPLDAVEAAIVIMEDDPAFNAGTGAVLNRDGNIELDALIIDGTTHRAGAVAAIRDVRNPISVARKVATATPYVLLVGEGATAFAREHGLSSASEAVIDQHRAWERMRHAGSLSSAGINAFTGQPNVKPGSDTVGCVVRSSRGSAAGVSTGGLFFKVPGRVGDSAIIGAGAVAFAGGAVAGTGLGEAFHELLLCNRVGRLLELGVHPQLAVEEALSYLHEKRNGIGGIIAVDSRGRIGVAHNGTTLAVATVINGQLCTNRQHGT